jgi:hypothetical protein
LQIQICPQETLVGQHVDRDQCFAHNGHPNDYPLAARPSGREPSDRPPAARPSGREPSDRPPSPREPSGREPSGPPNDYPLAGRVTPAPRIPRSARGVTPVGPRLASCPPLTRGPRVLWEKLPARRLAHASANARFSALCAVRLCAVRLCAVRPAAPQLQTPTQAQVQTVRIERCRRVA